jgi:hypothetical protein
MSAVMSFASTAVPPGNPLRRFGVTVLIATALTLAMWLLAPLEHALFSGPALGDSPAASAMLVLALPHYVIALAFMLTSTRNQGFADRLSIGAALLLGVVFCGWLYLASPRYELPEGGILLVGFYFLIHIYQDEWHFYRRDRGDRVSMDGGTVALLSMALIGYISTVAWMRATLIGDPVHNLRGLRAPGLIASIDPTLLCSSGCLLFAAVTIGCFYAAGRRSRSNVWSLIRREKSLWLIFWLIPHIYIVSVLLHGNSEPVVLIHAVSWWVVTTSALAGTGGQRFRKPAVWSRMRTTQAGFQWLHGTLAGVALVALLAIKHLIPVAHGPHIDWGRTVFYYSTVMHITVSMFPPWLKCLFGSTAAPRLPSSPGSHLPS